MTEPTGLRVFVETPDEKVKIDLPLSALSSNLSPTQQALVLAKSFMQFGVTNNDGREFYPAHTIYKMELRHD